MSYCIYMNCSNDVIAGKSKEAERKRINKELANIRSKFKGQFAMVGCTMMYMYHCIMGCLHYWNAVSMTTNVNNALCVFL